MTMIADKLSWRVSGARDGHVKPERTFTHGLPSVRQVSRCLLLCSLGFAPRLWAGDARLTQRTPKRAAAVVSVSAPSGTAPARLSGEKQSRTEAAETETQEPEYLVRELWSSRIGAPDPNEDAQTRLALRRLIKEVRSMRFAGEQAPQALAPAAGPETPGTAPVADPPAVPAEPTSAAPAPVAANGASAPGVTQASGNLPYDPNRVKDPLEVAELLFLSGRPAEAARFYRQALARTSPTDEASGPDRAWILFQLAHCLRETDMSKSQQTYDQLVSEYPGSPWTELARAQSQLLSWYQKDRPQQLVVPRQP